MTFRGRDSGVWVSQARINAHTSLHSHCKNIYCALYDDTGTFSVADETRMNERISSGFLHVCAHQISLYNSLSFM